ncbi:MULTISPECIES: LLM class flavin-dependent oxidoreductase [unclassified Sinorhizobium]|uniref:LLM class flavin-dependent oxidoreductase n=1 Tax=unclassified Sinorhizobium TaxID=2613772 RepID=UPI0035256D40
MRFALIQEGDFPPDSDTSKRYGEMVKEAVFAEKMGFDTYCLSEQHFLKETCTVSAPEVFFPYVAAQTERLRFRTTSAVLLSFNHPIRVAERLTTLDVLSDGRAELGTARSNNLNTLEGFGVSPDVSRAQWAESIDIILRALTQDTFEYDGTFWKVPPRTLSPKAIQTPHPPVYVSATSFETHTNAGERGIGVMTGNSILGWEYAQKCIDAYRDGLTRAKPASGSYVNDQVSFFVAVAHCSDTMSKAINEAARVSKTFIDLVIWLYSRLGSSSPDYAYLSAIKTIEARKEDLEYVLNSAPYFMVGTPDYLIERFRRLEEMGVDEVMLRIDGMGHETNLQAIEAFGTKVIPHFQKTRARSKTDGAA